MEQLAIYFMIYLFSLLLGEKLVFSTNHSHNFIFWFCTLTYVYLLLFLSLLVMMDKHISRDRRVRNMMGQFLGISIPFYYTINFIGMVIVLRDYEYYSQTLFVLDTIILGIIFTTTLILVVLSLVYLGNKVNKNIRNWVKRREMKRMAYLIKKIYKEVLLVKGYQNKMKLFSYLKNKTLIKFLGKMSYNYNDKKMIDVYFRDDTESKSGDCVICLCDLNKEGETIKLACDHKFHDKCVKEWFKTSVACPVCKRSVRITLLKTIYNGL